MAKFLSPLEVRCLRDGKRWTLLTDLRFIADDDQEICVPAGFITNFVHRRSAVPHDWICRTAYIPITKENADLYFLQGMIADGMAKWRARTLYNVVKYFGGSSYMPRTSDAQAIIMANKSISL
jgi:hypothetical protein|tara:strand:- start:1773 stop:2141 length:369 start_codon:yes stop_codon:yes gene_type:complete